MPFDAGSIDATLDLDINPFIAGIAAAQAYANAHPIKVPVETSGVPLVGGGVGVGGGGGGDGAAAGGGAGLGGLLGGIFGGGGSGGFGGIGGRGFGIPGLGALGKLPGIGSAGWLAGLGPERVLTTGLGIAGSAVGGALGGGILAAGAGATAAVGMGTDLAGIGQAYGDVQKYTAGMDKLNRAIAIYGANSIEAKAATYDFNKAMENIQPATVAALASLSSTVSQFKAQFDQATGAAEKTGANILQQVVTVGEKFLPVIGKYASENMLIIQKSLQPLFSWMQGPGLAIFTDFEKLFQERLPTAMHIFTQGFELIVKMLDYAANHTGNFLTTIDKIVTRFNSPAGTQKWHDEFDKLFSLFHTWLALFEIAFKDIYQFFSLTAGQGKAFAETLTGMLQHLHDYMTSVSGQQKIHTLFEAHKNELIALMQLLPHIISTFGQIELAFGPAFTTALTIIVKIVDAILKIPLIGPILADLAAFAYIFNKMGILPKVVDALVWMGTKVLWPVITAGLDAIAGGLEAIGIAVSSNVLGVIILGLALLGLAAYEIVKHWNTVKKWFEDFWKFMHSGWGQFISVSLAIIAPYIGIPLLIMEHWRGLETFFKTLWRNVQRDFEAFWQFMHGWAGQLITVAITIAAPWIGIPLLIMEHWRGLLGFFTGLYSGMKAAWDATWGWIKAIPTNIQNLFSGAINWLLKAGSDIITGLWHGLTAAWNTVWGWFAGLPRLIQGVFSGAISWLLGAGSDIITGLWHGITTAWGAVISWFSGLASTVGRAFLGADTWLIGAGEALVRGIVTGIGHIASQIGSALVGAVRSGWNDAKSALNSIPVVGGLFAGIGLAKGGYVTSPTLAIIGEDEPEWVIPRSYVMSQKAKVDALPTTGPSGVGGLGGSTTIHIENVHFRDQTDMRAFFNMADFYIQQGRLGVAG